jgi:hypothetical protein
MNSPFKFPRRVRIHGGECGAVARALHHEAQKDALMSYEQTLATSEKAVLSQADLEKASKSTIERKQMSTKTTLKRVALVAVSALGFGLMSSVAPVSATPREATTITIGTVPTCRALTSCSIPVTFNLPAATTTSDSFVVVAKVTSAPAASNSYGSAASGSVAAVTSSANDTAQGAGGGIVWAKPSSGSGSNGTLTVAGSQGVNATGATSTNNWAVAAAYAVAALDTAGQVTLNLKAEVDVEGTYTILVATIPPTVDSGTLNTEAQRTIAALAGYTSQSVTLTTGAAPTSVTFTNLTGGDAAVGSSSTSAGALLKISGAVLGGAETLTLSSPTTTVSFSDSVLDASDFTSGVAYVNVRNTAAGTVSISATQSGTLTGFTTSSTTVTFTSASTQAAPTLGFSSTDTTLAASTAIVAADNEKGVSTTRTTQTLRVTYDNSAGTAAFKTFITVTDVSGKITGKLNATFSRIVEIAAEDTVGYVDASVTATLLADQYWYATLYTTATASDTAGTIGVTRTRTTLSIFPDVDGVRSATSTGAVATPGTIRSAEKGTNKFYARVLDQFGGGMSGESVAVAVAGRNATTSSTLVTDASGYTPVYSLTDAGTSGTSDVITFTSSATNNVTIIYGTATVTTLTLTGGNTTDGVTSTTKTIKDIDGDSSGAEDGAQTITATLKDAAGGLMSGVPVTWSVAGTGVAITSTQKLKYSGTAGTATTTVYAWLAGTYTVTATAGGATATAEITFGQSTTTDARVVSATVSGSTITAKVADRFGNVIPGVTVYASRVSGTGYFGSGVTKTSTTTGQDGTAEFIVSGADAKVKVSVVSYDAAQGTTFGQTCAAAGKVDCPTDGTAATSFTAATVGTASTAETFVGSTYSPAGVESVTLDVTVVNAAANAAEAATDAAAEAIDAANAATDAANLAAEAADAATVAAEEARDAADAATAAVEELATQVATLMAALKAQITTLANTVAKIAKKVKA